MPEAHPIVIWSSLRKPRQPSEANGLARHVSREFDNSGRVTTGRNPDADSI